ncbi:TetR/AcrR family transcriptional regulator [Phyllobacterium endophyticum]|uniref:TetR/AcrR family transcriptional regulator n=1 Tax=Phyllobacterium endophyticum TaxID=1149773 RepID=A0A2P7AS58_9HYPH|nr:TetR/AcrR family transcriptional regulator [Phyllobacterium endophyticum]MBB3236789.1 AcrR family transcriptional regulator [Phyllobacterium endophyticum]PSH57061.1 TetR/AcrR family transcriptional regulator [Phyllobacterium endophyticum]TYR40342.1 TetR/AcrR family transcriptional regulator [Phyllobacterium endophyticum]
MVQRAENARERFEAAAFKLFGEQGYAATTVPDIAENAGLTERTFYRYFPDKREVLFWRATDHQISIRNEIASATCSRHPLAMVAHAFKSVAPFIDGHRPIVKLRQALISSHSDLQERELMKLHALASAIDLTLQQRGIRPSPARVIAEVGSAIWKVALENWRSDENEASFANHLDRVLAEFQTEFHLLV